MIGLFCSITSKVVRSVILLGKLIESYSIRISIYSFRGMDREWIIDCNIALG